MDKDINRKPYDVLIVGDFELEKQYWEEILPTKVYRKTFCCDISSMIRSIGRQQYDLILIDAEISEMKENKISNWMEFFAQDKDAQVYIFLDTTEKEGEEYPDADCFDIIYRPINPELLRVEFWQSLQIMRQLKHMELGQDILSFINGNPDYFNAIEAFVNNLPQRVEDIQMAFDAIALNELAEKLSSHKDSVETKSNEMRCSDYTQEVDDIFTEMDTIIKLCLVGQSNRNCVQPETEDEF